MKDETAEPVLYAQHLEQIGTNWHAALEEEGHDAVIILAGEPRNHFLDDQAPPLKLNPHFLHWCPGENVPGSALLVRPGKQPSLYFLQAQDYWHLPPDLPAWAGAFAVRCFDDAEALLAAATDAATGAGNRIAVIGDLHGDSANLAPMAEVNPGPLLNRLHYARAVKTAFELHCMRKAAASAVRGHLAARQSFFDGESEFRIHLAYLTASGQLPAELPYPNIIAMNEHAGVLHYQHYDRQPPEARLSFLIDAGGNYNGYAADITRTYSWKDAYPHIRPDARGRDLSSRPNAIMLFSELIQRLDAAQQALIAAIRPGQPFLDLHIDMHRRLAGILSETGIARSSAESVFDAGVTETFFPHGLGHLIGLQTHDVGGLLRGPDGGSAPPPHNYPSLRLTRTLEENMPVTIEPGLYLIPQLLDAARNGAFRRMLDWDIIEALLPCGGIRIEDNVVPGARGVENLTRDAFARLDVSA